MIAATTAVPTMITANPSTSPMDMTELPQVEHQLDGSQPYVRIVKFDAACSPSDLLPDAAIIERCVTTDTSVTVLARLDDATLHIVFLPRSTTLRVTAATHARAEKLATELRSKAPDPRSGTVSVRIWHSIGSLATSTDRTIDAPRWIDTRQNYPEAVRTTLDAVLALERPMGTGKLLLWHGPPGTGKTTALRALMRCWSTWCQPQYIADPERFFGEPMYMTQVLATAPLAEVGPTLTRVAEPEAIWRLVVAEDVDEILRANARRDASAALGRLLNLTDGILGQGMNVLLLLTANEDVSRLDPALVRPGRSLAAVEFTLFDVREASEWLRAPVVRSATLADLLEQRGDLSRIGPQSRPREVVGQYL